MNQVNLVETLVLFTDGKRELIAILDDIYNRQQKRVKEVATAHDCRWLKYRIEDYLMDVAVKEYNKTFIKIALTEDQKQVFCKLYSDRYEQWKLNRQDKYNHQ